MNKTFALVWSDTRGGWVAASECARRRGKSAGGLRLSAVALALLGAVGLAQAQDLPTTGVIQHGTGQIAVEADKKTMRIQQKTDKMIIDWQRFDIGEGKQVIFDQPGRSSAVLNKVLGMHFSHINGALTSNGRVFLMNPNGIYFGSSSQVKVGGLVASTKLVSDDDFLGDGLMRFSGRSNASVVNDGSITAEDGGSVVMLSEGVSNYGHIRADQGGIALGSGQAFILGFGGNSMLDLQVERGAMNAIVENMGTLQANGGKVLLKGRSTDGVGALVVNNAGLIEARSLNGKSGAIVLDGGDSAQIDVGGKLIATGGDGMPGGTVWLRGKSVLFRPDVLIDTRSASGNNGLLSIISTHISVARDAYAAGPRHHLGRTNAQQESGDKQRLAHQHGRRRRDPRPAAMGQRFGPVLPGGAARPRERPDHSQGQWRVRRRAIARGRPARQCPRQAGR
ncbi:filamentous hemagglutinin N-terminal domain-containing protein [Achromobacter piechaudii]|nr:filamentous hemagglutinin N-terminal domain-containing protein [Achromobacter piechaudii]